MIFIFYFKDFLANEMQKSNNKYTLEEYKYGLDILFNTLGTIIIVISISLMFGWFKQAVITLFWFGVIRFFSGGFHFKTSIACILGTTSIIYLILFLYMHNLLSRNIIDILYVISLIIFMIFAPHNIEQVLKVKINFKYVFKIITIAIVLVNIMIKSDLLTLTFFIQSLTTIGFRK